MTTRQEKVNSLIQREISSYLLTEGWEGISGLLTITRVEVSPDLGQAKVFFSVVGQDSEEVLAVLQKHLYQIQGRLLERLRMKTVPRVTFLVDQSGEYAQHIGKLLHELHDHDQKSS